MDVIAVFMKVNHQLSWQYYLVYRVVRALMVCGLCIFERGDLKVAKTIIFA